MTGKEREHRRFDAKVCLQDMLECALAIQEYVEGMTLDVFLTDRRTQDAVLRRLEVMGEAAGRLLRAQDCALATRLPLKIVYGMRNALIHGYDGVDFAVVWQTVVRDVPKLAADLTRELG